MPWFKVDDGFSSHPKVMALKRGSERIRAVGLWTLAGSWSAEHGFGGRVPDYILEELGATQKDIDALLRVRLWEVVDGVEFHDWDDYQPDAATLQAQKVKESISGQLGNHRRWHVKRGVAVPDCEFCYCPPDRDPDEDDAAEHGMSDNESITTLVHTGGTTSVDTSPPKPRNAASRDKVAGQALDSHREPDRVPDRVNVGSASPVPEPEPDSKDSDESLRVAAAIEPASRADVDRLCDHLADRVEANGAKRPPVTTKWRDAARLMLDRDGRTEAEVRGAIDWCQADEFWRGNVMSMPKLRERYDQLLLQAQRKPRVTTRQQETDDLFARSAARMGVQR